MSQPPVKARLSLSIRIILGVVVLILVASAVQIYLTNRLARQAVLAELQSQLHTKVHSHTKLIRGTLDAAQADALYLASLPSLSGLVRAIQNNGFDDSENQSSNILTKRLQGRLSSFIDANPEYYQVSFLQLNDVPLHESGRELIRVRSTAGHVEVVTAEHLQVLTQSEYITPALALKAGEVFISDIYVQREAALATALMRRSLNAVTPIYDGSGSLFGLLILQVDLGEALDQLSSDNVNHLLTFMYSQHGEYFIHPNSAYTFGRASGHSHNWQRDIKTVAGVPVTNNQTQLSALPSYQLTAFTLGEQSFYGVHAPVQLDDSRYINLVYAVEEHYITARNRSTNIIILISAGTIACLIGAFIFGFVRSLLAPLVQLSNVAHALGDGLYETAIPNINVPELDELGRSLNMMRHKIIARDREIIDSSVRLQASLAYADLIIESMPEAIIILNATGKIIRANQRANSLFGYSPEELMGSSMAHLLSAPAELEQDALRSAFNARLKAQPQGQNLECGALRKDGRVVPVDIGLNSLPGQGELTVLATVIDLTHIKKNEEALLHTNTRFRLAASAAGLGFWDYDLASQTLQWDDTTYRIYGLEKRSDAPQPYSLWTCAIHPEDLAANEHALRASIEGDAPFDTEFRIIHPDKNVRVIKAQACVLRDTTGRALKLYGVNLDITERKRSEHHQLHLLREMTAINAELNSFTYIASHDLKSPLRGIDQLASWIAEDLAGQLDENTQKHISLMRNRIKRMERLLDDLLVYSRAGRTMGDKCQVDTHALIDDIFDLLSAGKPARLHYLSPMPLLTTQRTPLELILRNLIGNAIKHHPGGTIELYIEAQKRRGGFEFGVGDNGAGIAPEHHAKIFTMFQTLKPRDVVEGSGIGLALVKKTVEGFGGKIRVESDGVSGSWFYFTWPDDQNPKFIGALDDVELST